MVSRMYTVEDGTNTQSYKGFDRDYTASRLDRTVLVRVEDAIEVWALDSGPTAHSEFIRFMSERDDAELCVILGEYHRD